MKTHKLFVAGNVYDTALLSKTEIENDVQNNLESFIGTDKVKFGLDINGDNVTMVFIRFTEYSEKDLSDKLMKDADAYMVTAEGHNGFRMPSPFPKAPFGYPCMIEQAEFVKAYKESAFLLGADAIKWAKIEITPHSVVLRLKL